MIGQPSRPYHHGHLRDALLEAGLELTRTGGPEALGLREVTRQVGVSPNAAYRHFADRRSLLEAVADRVRTAMAVAMTAAGDQPREETGEVRTDAGARAVAALRLVGTGYIEFALTEPGWFDVAFAGVVFEPDGSAARVAGSGSASGSGEVPPPPAPFVALVRALDGLVDAGLLDPYARPGAEWPCWSAVHGFAVLAVHGPLAAFPLATRRTLAVRTVDTVVAGLLRPPPPGPTR